MSTDTPNRERQGAIKTPGPATNGKPASATPPVENVSHIDGELENGSDVSAAPKPVTSTGGEGEGLVATNAAQTTNGGDSTTGVNGAGDSPDGQDGEAVTAVATSSTLVDDEVQLLTGPAVVEASRDAVRAATALARLPGWMPRIDDRLSRLILSAVLAILLWFYVVNLENPTQNAQFSSVNIAVRGAASSMKATVSPD